MYALNCQFFIALTKKTFYTSSFSGLPFNRESPDLATAYRGGSPEPVTSPTTSVGEYELFIYIRAAGYSI